MVAWFGWQSRQSDRGEKWCKMVVMVNGGDYDGDGGGYDGDGGVLWCGRGWWWCGGPDNPIEGQSGVRWW